MKYIVFWVIVTLVVRYSPEVKNEYGIITGAQYQYVVGINDTLSREFTDTDSVVRFIEGSKKHWADGVLSDNCIKSMWVTVKKDQAKPLIIDDFFIRGQQLYYADSAGKQFQISHDYKKQP